MLAEAEKRRFSIFQILRKRSLNITHTQRHFSLPLELVFRSPGKKLLFFTSLNINAHLRGLHFKASKNERMARRQENL